MRTTVLRRVACALLLIGSPGCTALAKYDRALERLDAETREAVIARIEMGCSYAEIAEAMGKPSPDAARMAVSRALVRLAEEMRRD